MPADIEFATPPFYAFFSSYGANGEYYGDRAYSAQSFAQVFIKFFKTGVIGADAHQTPSTTFQPLQIMARERLKFTIKAGAALIDGHVGEVFDGTVGTLENADGVYNRIDRVVMRLYGGDGKDERKLVPHIITGIPAANPVPPPIVRDGTDYDLSLATILVPAGATAITQANITDTRFDLDVCGFVRLAFELPMDTTDLFAQFSAVFHEFMAQLEETMGENVATNLLNLINAQTERLTDYEGKTDTKIATLESTSASHTSTLSSHSSSISSLNSRLNKIGTFTTLLNAVSPRNGNTFTLSQSIFNFNYIVVWANYVQMKEMRSVKAYTYIKNIDTNNLNRWFNFSSTGSNYNDPAIVESESVIINSGDGVTVYYGLKSHYLSPTNRLIILGMN